MLTNTGLVKHVKMALNEKWGYVWGTFGQYLTPTLLQEKSMQYPDGVGKHVQFIRENWLNKKTADCVGLIKSYIWWNPILHIPVYDPNTDVSADNMYNKASVKGSMDAFPEIPGLCVWKEGHIGIYVGNGEVIEAHGTFYGVIKTPLKGSGSTPWTHWLQCPYIAYETAVPVTKKTYVQLIQEASNGSAEDWIKGIDTAVAAARADGNLGALEIFKYLPLLLEKIGNR